MNNKLLLSGLVGCICGAVTSYIVVKKYYKKKSQEKISNILQQSSKDRKKLQEELKGFDNCIVEEIECDVVEGEGEDEDSREFYNKKLIEEQYASELSPDEDDYIEDNEPREITEELFFDTCLYNDKIHVRIYSDDAIVSDEDEYILPGFIGEDITTVNVLAGLREWFVRNPLLHCDYHIEVVEAMYNYID